MILLYKKKAEITEPSLVIKARDTVDNIEEGHQIKEVYGKSTWTVGFYMTGEYFSLSKKIKTINPAEFAHTPEYSRDQPR